MFYAEAKASARESQSQTHGQLLLCLCSLPLPPSRDRLHDVVCVPDTIVATGPCCLPEIPSFLESRRKNFFLPLTFGWPEWDVSICARSFRLFFDRLAVTSLATFAVQCVCVKCTPSPQPPFRLTELKLTQF